MLDAVSLYRPPYYRSLPLLSFMGLGIVPVGLTFRDMGYHIDPQPSGSPSQKTCGFSTAPVACTWTTT